jgi:hypothetical protein
VDFVYDRPQTLGTDLAESLLEGSRERSFSGDNAIANFALFSSAAGSLNKESLARKSTNRRCEIAWGKGVGCSPLQGKTE